MADNVGYTEGSGKTIAADDIGGALHQRVKVSVGADGVAADWDGAVTVSGVATSAKQDSQTTLLTAIDGHVDGLETSAASLDAKTPALGQALAAASTPVVLTAAQLSTLTPPAAITGFATESTLSTLNGKVTAVNTGAVTISAALPAGANAIGKLAANDGVDIGDVTINNASGGSAVNIQDGGNSITVDGTVGVSGTVTVDSELPAAATLADGAALPTTPTVGAGTYVYNGTTLDLAREVVNGQNTTGTGIQAAGILGQLDDTSTGTVTENQFAPVRISTRRAMLVEGVASGTAIATTISSTTSITPGNAAANLGKAEDAVHASGDTGVMALGVRADTAASTAANGDYVPFLTDSVGQVWVNSAVGAASICKAEDAVAASGDVGIMALAVRSDTAAATAANGDYVPLLVDANGRQHTNAILSPFTSGGLTYYHLVSAASTNATNIKASAGQLYGWYIYNSNAAARKLAFHNTAGTPTAGASVVFSIVIPPTSAANVFTPIGIAFATGIAITTVTELTDAGTTGVAASDLIINLFYS